jgi:hypothetical protein
MNEGLYYLHKETKDLIFKKFEPENDSPFVQKTWALNTSNREDAWTIVLEALALGVKIERAVELSRKWGLTFEDSVEMLKRLRPTKLMVGGIKIFIKQILNMEVDEYWGKVKPLLK